MLKKERILIILLLILLCIVFLASPPQRVEYKHIKYTETIEVETIKEVPVVMVVETQPAYTFEVTSTEREMLARLVLLEAGSKNIEAQAAVISVIFNRLNNPNKDYRSIEDVIFEKNQFSTAKSLYKITPVENNYKAVDLVLKDGVTIPPYIEYFRGGLPHSWGTFYMKIGGNYFSYDEKYKEFCENNN